MFERFTVGAHEAIRKARMSAVNRGSRRIAPEDMLVGLASVSDCVAREVLEAAGVNRRQLIAVAIAGAEHRGPPTDDVHIKFDRGTRRAMEEALRGAIGVGHGHVGTHHLLLGIARAADSTAAARLASLGLDAAQLAEIITRVCSAHGAPTEPAWRTPPETLIRMDGTVDEIPRGLADAVRSPHRFDAAELDVIERDGGLLSTGAEGG